MSLYRFSGSRYFVTFFVALLGIFFVSTELPIVAQIEHQSIAGGGTVTGKLENPNATSGDDYVIVLNETDAVVIAYEQLRKKEILSPNFLEYRLMAPFALDTINSHQQIAQQCRDNNMPQESRLHWERILEIDPDNETARKSLGYEKMDGVWMTPKERRESAGNVVYGGKSVTRQEAELLRQRDENRAQTSQWKKRIRSIQNGLKNNSDEARDELRLISAPEALVAITDALRSENNPQNRVLYVMTMGKIGSPAALGDLAAVIIADENDDVRQTAVEIIRRHPRAIPGAIEYFCEILKHPEKYMNSAINRAGYALEQLDALSAIPDLINGLVTRHTETVVIPGEQTSATFSSDGNFSFNPGSQDRTKDITQEFENPDVLSAIRTIAANHYGDPVDFGYDKEAWKKWLLDKEDIQNFRPRRDR